MSEPKETLPREKSEFSAAPCSAVEIARRDIARLEHALGPILQLARIAHSSSMRASEEIGNRNETGAAHACLGLIEVAMRALNQANDAARYSRHALTYPPNDQAQRPGSPDAEQT